jgi:hypothetical protein
MRILLALCIPAIWVWAITLSMIVRSYFDYALYQDYRSITMMMELLFPIIAVGCTYILWKTIKELSKSE